MVYKNIDGINCPVSQIVMGTNMFFNQEEQESYEHLLDSVFEMGVNTFDSAWCYCNGQSERTLGQWIKKRDNRKDVVIITKCAHPTIDRYRSKPFDILSQFEDSMARLDTDYIDVFMLHRDDMSNPVEPVVETMTSLVEQGRILTWGGANWTSRRIDEANNYAVNHGLVPMHCSSANYSLGKQLVDPWGWNSVSLAEAGCEAECEWYMKNQMPVFAYSCLGIGWFSGEITRKTYAERNTRTNLWNPWCLKAYDNEENLIRIDRCEELAEKYGVKIPQIAMAYVLKRKEMNLFALVGAWKPEEMREAVEALNIPLTDEEIKYLNLEV